MARRKKTIAKQEVEPAPNASTPDTGSNVLLDSRCPIIGIGASAGGLEALELFLKNVPPLCGLGFVVVQHLDPTHKGIMVELLQRATAMPVVQVKDRMKVEPDNVYVIPPNRDLSILHGALHLLEPSAPRGLRLPIDFFFRSLADDQQEHSIGVILSGSGSDGTLGLRAIKEKAGAVFVQSPESAKFDGMPRSAIDSGMADVVAPVEELAGKIVAYLQHIPCLIAHPGTDFADKDRSGLEKVVLILRTQTGHDFSLYKKNTIYRRIERRMGLHQLSKIADYVRYLRVNPQESNLLFRELLIGVTSFFRDPAAWEQVETEAIPALLAASPNGAMLRAWVPGCSTGEEAYSLAIAFREALDRLKPDARYALQIFATDLDKEAVDKARTGAYPANIVADVNAERLHRSFAQEERGYRVSKEIREMVIFAPQNLVMDPPFTKLDMLLCRNLLIYLEAELQKKLLPLFHYSLRPGGILLLGNSETIGAATDLFEPLPGKSRLYRRRDTAGPVDRLEFPAAFTRTHVNIAASTRPAPTTTPNVQALTDSMLLQHFAPAAVLTTSTGDIVYFSGKTGQYLEPPIGKANLNLFAMAREGLGSGLEEAFARALRQKIVVQKKCVAVGRDGGGLAVDITVQLLSSPAELNGMLLVVFADAPAPPVTKARGKSGGTTVLSTRKTASAEELLRAREELQTTREEMQTSQEELRSSNEELQSANEELQSMNEELTTSKEEMQSMNEELQTVNHELQAKVYELTQTNDDMRNLFDSTEIATLFLDSRLNVRRFTPQAAEIIKLIPGDTGRPITDLVTDLNYPELATDAHEVLRSLVFRERQVTASGDRWFTVRIIPYRTQDNRIDGVLITFLDISAAKALEARLRKADAE